MIIEGAASQEENDEIFDNFDCPECDIRTQLCEETKRALILYYQEKVIKSIEEKQMEIKQKERQVKSEERSKRNSQKVRPFRI